MSTRMHSDDNSRGRRRRRRRMILLLAVLVLGSAVYYHHAEPSGMGEMIGGAICLAVLAGGALLLSEIRSGLLPRFRPLPLPRPRSLGLPPSTRSVPARAGPLFLRLAVLRR